MRNQTYNNATVVQLSPDGGNSNIQVATFDEAFGGHSNLFSGLRAKMKEKKAKNVKRIQTAKQSIHADKTATKVAKQANKGKKKVARKAKKTVKKLAKQSGKSEVMKAKQGRKTDKKQLKQERKAMGREEEPMEDEELYDTPEDATEEEGYESDSEAEEVESDDTEPTGDEETEEVEETEEWYPEESDEDPDYGFNGEEAESSFNSEVNDAAVVIQIHPAVRDTAKKIVWNQLKANSFKNKIGRGGNDAELQACADGHNERANELESMLGEYSEAAGGQAGRAQRCAMIRQAKREAMVDAQQAMMSRKRGGFGHGRRGMNRPAGSPNRYSQGGLEYTQVNPQPVAQPVAQAPATQAPVAMDVPPPPVAPAMAAPSVSMAEMARPMEARSGADGRHRGNKHRVQSEFSQAAGLRGQATRVRPAEPRSNRPMPLRRKSGADGETVVESELDPQIGEDEIIIPSEDIASAEGGTGTGAHDGSTAAENADVRKVELNSNMSGDALKNVNWKGVAVGTGIAVAIIAVLKVTKVI